MLNCWQEDANDRPTFEGLRRELKRMENQHKVNSHKPKQTNKQNFNKLRGSHYSPLVQPSLWETRVS